MFSPLLWIGMEGAKTGKKISNVGEISDRQMSEVEFPPKAWERQRHPWSLRLLPEMPFFAKSVCNQHFLITNGDSPSSSSSFFSSSSSLTSTSSWSSQEYLAQKAGFQPTGPLCQAMPGVWHLKSTKKGHFRFFAQLDMKCASKWVACPIKCAWEMAGHTDAVIRELPEAKTGQTAKLSKPIQLNSWFSVDEWTLVYTMYSFRRGAYQCVVNGPSVPTGENIVIMRKSCRHDLRMTQIYDSDIYIWITVPLFMPRSLSGLTLGATQNS